MSTTEDFENASFGATATRDLRNWVVKADNSDQYWITPWGSYLSDEQVGLCGYTLDPLEPAPTTAREALDLAWELAHEVKPGQVIPKGTRYVRSSQGGRLATFTATEGWTPTPRNAEYIRTLDPLPAPEPDWLDAPAVLARLDEWDRDKLDVFTPAREGEGRWNRIGTAWTFHWNELRDVTPLYPKGQNA